MVLFLQYPAASEAQPWTHHPSAVDMGLSRDKTGHEGDLNRQWEPAENSDTKACRPGPAQSAPEKEHLILQAQNTSGTGLLAPGPASPCQAFGQCSTKVSGSPCQAGPLSLQQPQPCPPPITFSPQGLPDMRSQQLHPHAPASPAQDCSGLDMTPCPTFASYVLATVALRCSVHLISPCLGWQVHREQHQMVTGPGSCWGGARPSLTPGLEAVSACQLR